MAVGGSADADEEVNADDKRQAAELIELDGGELRRGPLGRSQGNAHVGPAKARVGIRYNEHLEFDDGEASNEKDLSHLTRAIERAYGTSLRRRGQSVKAEEDFKAYRHAALFPNDLDAIVMRAVKPLFVRGDYDTAVFRAFKEVEVRVRKKSGLGKEHFGRGLMQRAFCHHFWTINMRCEIYWWGDFFEQKSKQTI